MGGDRDLEARIEELLKLLHHKVIRGDSVQGFLGEVPELPGCLTSDETEAEALGNLREAMTAWFEDALANDAPIPMPKGEGSGAAEEGAGS
jgi:predicted RNase H-like HicB family nuclease